MKAYLVIVFLWIGVGAASAQDYWKARDVLTNFAAAIEKNDAAQIGRMTRKLDSTSDAMAFLAGLPSPITLNDELVFSECRANYALMLPVTNPDLDAEVITILFKEIPKGVWERFWVIENVFDSEGNQLPNIGFDLNSTSGNFTDLSEQVRALEGSPYLGLAPYGKLNTSYLNGRQLKTDLNSTRLTFDNIQVVDTSGTTVQFIYLTLSYQGEPQQWEIADIGPMSERWLGRDPYVDALIADFEKKQEQKASAVVRLGMPDTTFTLEPGDSTLLSGRKNAPNTEFLHVADKGDAVSIGKSHRFLNMQMYPLGKKGVSDSDSVYIRSPLSLGLSLGFNQSFVTLQKIYSTGNILLDSASATYKGQSGWLGSLDLRYQWKKNISIGLNISYKKLEYRYANEANISDPGAGIDPWLRIDYRERIRSLEGYLFGMYEFRKKADSVWRVTPKPRWVPFVEVGAGYSYLLGADAEVQQTLSTVGTFPETGNSGPLINYSLKNYRVMPMVTPGIGLGIRLETGRSDFKFRVRYLSQIGPMSNVVSYKDSTQRSLLPLSLGLVHEDDDFALSQLQFSIGYAYVFKTSKTLDELMKLKIKKPKKPKLPKAPKLPGKEEAK